MDMLHSLNIGFAVKLVRGAYLEKERSQAVFEKYPDPTNESYDATSAMYHRSMEYVLARIKEHPGKTSVIIASHNENTVEKAIARYYQNNFKYHQSVSETCLAH